MATNVWLLQTRAGTKKSSLSIRHQQSPFSSTSTRRIASSSKSENIFTRQPVHSALFNRLHPIHHLQSNVYTANLITAPRDAPLRTIDSSLSPSRARAIHQFKFAQVSASFLLAIHSYELHTQEPHVNGCSSPGDGLGRSCVRRWFETYGPTGK